MAVTAVVVSRIPLDQYHIPSSLSLGLNQTCKAPTPLFGFQIGRFLGEKPFLIGAVHQAWRAGTLRRNLNSALPKAMLDSRDLHTYHDSPSNLPRHVSEARKYNRHPQNVDLPSVLPKGQKKPYLIPIQKMRRAGRLDKKLAQMGVERYLIPPKNGLLVPELIPIAHRTLESWKVLIEGLAQLLTVVPVYGCRKCSEVHVGPCGHSLQDCSGFRNVKQNQHVWIRGTINDVLIPIESYHMFDPFGHRINHANRFNYERIPAVVELCIQAGVDLPQCPSRRRTSPVRMIGRKVIDRGGFVEEPKMCKSEDVIALLSEIDTFAVLNSKSISPPADTKKVAERTLKAYSTARSGLSQLMKRYTVKACRYCSEVHVGPWGHNAKLCGAFKHQWRDGKHGWQDAAIDEVIPQNFVWHLKDLEGPPLTNALKKFYGKAPAVVEVCVQAGAVIPDAYRPMMRLDIVIPEIKEAKLVA